MDIDKTIQSASEYYQAGDLQRAEHICSELLKVNPDNADALHLLGLIYYKTENYDLAIQHIEKAVKFNPADADAYYNLGNAHEAKGQLDEAITYYQKAIDLDPTFAEAHNNLGFALYSKGQLDEAIMYHQRAIELRPNFPEAYNNLGFALHDKGKLEETIRCYQKALKLNPHYPEAYNNLGLAFQDNKQLDEALSCYRKAIEIDQDFAEAYNNIGQCLYLQQGKVDDAMTYFDKAIQIDPDCAVAHWNKSLALLVSGNFKEGLKEFEWRWKLRKHYPYNFVQPLWDGSEITGLTILLHADGVFGDTIQYIRYAPLIAHRGVNVIVECHKELKSLLKNVKGVQEVIARGEPLIHFDVHCPIMSLPLAFDTILETIPSDVPYITVDPALVMKWHEKIRHDNSKLKVGLVWKGSDREERLRYRSCTLEQFSPLARLEGITFYSLQKGEAAQQAKNPPDGMKLLDYTEEITDFSDTAALMENLDLIISVDTAAAHLAGAIGMPVWTLLPFAVDNRWLLNREDTPWYPTMRLFRQPSLGDQESVINNVLIELQKKVKEQAR